MPNARGRSSSNCSLVISEGVDDTASRPVTPPCHERRRRPVSPLKTDFEEATMKVFVAGASGALGSRLVPLLAANGHDVTATTRTPAKAERLRALGAEAVVADGLDRKAVLDAVARSEPEVVIHQMTALKGLSNLKRFDKEFEVTNRLRTRGLDYLMEGARLAGVRRVVAQSFGG